MKKIVNNWYVISVYLSGLAAMAAVFVTEYPLKKILLMSICMLFLHFYEEFGVPGGFPLLGMKVMMGSDEMDKSKWNCNNLNSMFGNWLALMMLYVMPLLFPRVRFLVFAAMFLSVAELVMHLVLFNIKMKTLYNPGLITGVFGLAPIAIYYFINIHDGTAYYWYDYVLGVVYFAVVFFFCYRSKLYWSLGAREGYTLTDQSAFGLYRR